MSDRIFGTIGDEGPVKGSALQASMSESAVRGRAKRRGFAVIKSRQQLHLNNCGEYMLVDFNNWVMFGERYDATLEEIDELPSCSLRSEATLRECRLAVS